ncbi:MAG: DUF167 family protein [Candidatus Wallbacteria bacterium]|nr:DUF167 family protein [Candidatus Wallbacteria bacterium]
MFRAQGNDVLFDLQVKPDSNRVTIKVKKGIVQLSVTKPPVHNQANREIVKELTDFFASVVDIEKSLPGYRKLIRVKNMTMDEVKARLGMNK